MRLTPVLVSLPVWFALATATTPTPSGTPTPTPTATPASASPSAAASPSPSPSPSPIPENAFLTLDITDGGPNTQITVNGGAFLPNERMTLYWDQPSKVAGSAVADGNGNFSAPNIKPFSGDTPGVHKLCASVAPNPCANFTLEAAASPSPSPSPTESPSPSASPEATATPASSPTPVAATLNGLDVISKPPFVFLPIIGALAIAVSLGYWVLSIVRRPRPTPIPSAAVVHRAMRPDYSAQFGTPPPTPAPAAPEPSAWAETAPARQPEAAVPPPAEPPPAPEPPAPEWDTGASPTEWGTGTPDAGYPFAAPPETHESSDLPEPGD